jgi:hypothetical protein
MNKFQRYTPYLKIVELQHELDTVAKVKKVLKDVFPSLDFKEATWQTYTRTLISWISYLGLIGISNIEVYSFDIKKNGNLPSRKLETQSITFTPQKPILDDIDIFMQIVNNKDELDIKKKMKFLYDLSAIGVLHYWKEDVILSKEGIMISELEDNDEIQDEFSILAKKMDKVSKAVNIVKENNITTIKDFRINAQDLVSHINSDVYKRQTLGKLFSWAKFVLSREKTLEDEIQ